MIKNGLGHNDEKDSPAVGAYFIASLIIAYRSIFVKNHKYTFASLQITRSHHGVTWIVE
jgi:hypothetical protein